MSAAADPAARHLAVLRGGGGGLAGPSGDPRGGGGGLAGPSGDPRGGGGGLAGPSGDPQGGVGGPAGPSGDPQGGVGGPASPSGDLQGGDGGVAGPSGDLRGGGGGLAGPSGDPQGGVGGPAGPEADLQRPLADLQRRLADLQRRLDDLRRRVERAATDAGRDPATVKILLATKTQPPELIAAAVRAGFPLIGENRAQEVTDKASALTKLLSGTHYEQHFIGHLQSNKIATVLPHVSCVQSVDSAELASKLADKATLAGRVLDVYAQVNVSGEPTKSGAVPDRAPELAAAIRSHPALLLSGLMTIGLNSTDRDAVSAGYRRLATLADRLGLAELSMGMSGDFELAIAAGATIVRLGSAAFGPRPVR